MEQFRQGSTKQAAKVDRITVSGLMQGRGDEIEQSVQVGTVSAEKLHAAGPETLGGASNKAVAFVLPQGVHCIAALLSSVEVSQLWEGLTQGVAVGRVLLPPCRTPASRARANLPASQAERPTW